MSLPRLPPGQRQVKGLPVLHEGSVPAFDPSTWRLRIHGLVENEISLSWTDFSALPAHGYTEDFHCVTTWSRFDARWAGVPVLSLLERARPLAGARHALIRSFDGVGYSTNLPLSDLARPRNLLATHVDGAPLSDQHGGPVRLVVHHLYAWKSAKWVREIELSADERPGYWEQRGYHRRGDPWAEERLADPANPPPGAVLPAG